MIEKRRVVRRTTKSIGLIHTGGPNQRNLMEGQEQIPTATQKCQTVPEITAQTQKNLKTMRLDVCHRAEFNHRAFNWSIKDRGRSGSNSPESIVDMQFCDILPKNRKRTIRLRSAIESAGCRQKRINA